MTGFQTAGAPAPTLSTNRRYAFFAALVVDAVGSGLWLPFALIFFTRAQGQSLQVTGAAMTGGGLLGLLIGLSAGHLVDRYGAGAVTIAGNVLRFLSFACYPLVQEPWQLVLVVSVTACAGRMYWTANAPMLSTLFHGRKLDDVMGLSGVLGIIGLGVGAGVAGLTAESVTGLRAIAFANAASFLAAGLLLALALGRSALAVPRPDGGAVGAGGSPVSPWSDRPYLLLCLVQVILAFAASAFVIILPVVVLTVLDGPNWLPALSVVAGNVAIATAQKPVLRLARRVPRVRMLIASVTLLTFSLLLPTAAPAVPTGLVVPLILAMAVVGGVAEATSVPLMVAAANHAAPDGYQGRYSAVFQTGWGVAEVAAPLCLTSLLTIGNTALWLTVSALVLLTIPLLLHLRTRLPAPVLHTTVHGH